MRKLEEALANAGFSFYGISFESFAPIAFCSFSARIRFWVNPQVAQQRLGQRILRLRLRRGRRKEANHFKQIFHRLMIATLNVLQRPVYGFHRAVSHEVGNLLPDGAKLNRIQIPLINHTLRLRFGSPAANLVRRASVRSPLLRICQRRTPRKKARRFQRASTFSLSKFRIANLMGVL